MCICLGNSCFARIFSVWKLDSASCSEQESDGLGCIEYCCSSFVMSFVQFFPVDATKILHLVLVFCVYSPHVI